MKRASLLMVIIIIAVIAGATFCSTVNASIEKTNIITLRDAKTQLDNYIKTNHPEIIIGEQDYINFLVDQLMTASDKQLASKPYYEDCMIYAVKYITAIDNNESELDTSKGECELTLTDKSLDRSIRQVKAEYAKNNQENDENAIINKETDIKMNAAAKGGYDPVKAANYGYNHGTSYNTPAYPRYAHDCTNFVSQCIKAGGKSFNYAPGYKDKPTKYSTTKYWYSYHYTDVSPVHRYKQSTSFMNVSNFYTYWKNHGATIIKCKNTAALQKNAKKGDIVQLNNGEWYHSIIISRGKKGDWKYASHTSDRKARSVNTIKNNSFRIIRIK